MLGHCAVATVAVCGFDSWSLGSLVFHCGMPRQIFPLPSTPSQTEVCSTKERKHKTVVSSQPNASPFNGDAQSGNDIERSLSRVVVPPSLPVSATTFPTALSVYIAQGRLRKDIRVSKLFSKTEPVPFEKEININLVYSSCLKHANEMVLGDPRQAHQRTQSLHFPSSFINHSTIACCSNAQTPSSLSHT